LSKGRAGDQPPATVSTVDPVPPHCRVRYHGTLLLAYLSATSRGISPATPTVPTPNSPRIPAWTGLASGPVNSTPAQPCGATVGHSPGTAQFV